MAVKNDVEPTKHKPPSRIKYERNNPVFSIRMPQAWHNTLKAYLQETGNDRKKFMALALNKLKINYEQASRQGYEKGNSDGYNNGLREGKTLGIQESYSNGYWRGKTEWAIGVNCCCCGLPLDIKPDSREHRIIKRELRRYFFCSKCLLSNP
jgi:flagellar biosynthesis/type III secretory pathway protein FliH